MKQESAACERNKDPILAILRRVFSDSRRVLEIGSGTGQHAAYFAEHLPHLIWHTSDLPEYHPSLNAYIDESPAQNLRRPFVLDTGVSAAAGSVKKVLEREAKQASRTKEAAQSAGSASADRIDAVFTANTVQIMSEADIVGMFALLGELLSQAGDRLCLYSPLQYDGRHTSRGNAEFDAALRARDPQMGVRDFVWLDGLARGAGFVLEFDHEMPANNRLLEYRRD